MHINIQDTTDEASGHRSSSVVAWTGEVGSVDSSASFSLSAQSGAVASAVACKFTRAWSMNGG